MVTAIHDAHALVSAASRAQPRRRGCLIHAETLAWLGLRSLLTDSSSITLVGEAVTETQALHAAPTRPPATASGHGQRQSRRHAASCLNLVDAPRSAPFSLGQRSEWPVLAHPQPDARPPNVVALRLLLHNSAPCTKAVTLLHTVQASHIAAAAGA